MAIEYITRPFTIKTSNGTSATLTEETGTTNDNRIIVARTLTAGIDGKFIGEMGTVTGRNVSVKVVSFDRSTESYKSDYQDAKEFDRSVGDALDRRDHLKNRGHRFGLGAAVAWQV